MDALCENTCGETVVGIIGSSDDLIIVRESQNLHDWAKDFLSGNGHIVSDVSENGWLNEVTSVSDSVASTKKGGTFVLATLDVAHNFVKLLLRNLWSLTAKIFSFLEHVTNHGL